jgi:hypothetical protein
MELVGSEVKKERIYVSIMETNLIAKGVQATP